MVFLHKLARRLAQSPRMAIVGVLALMAACGGDTNEPDVTTADQSSAAPSLGTTVRRRPAKPSSSPHRTSLSAPGAQQAFRSYLRLPGGDSLRSVTATASTMRRPVGGSRPAAIPRARFPAAIS